jgi:hypothetical protein
MVRRYTDEKPDLDFGDSLLRLNLNSISTEGTSSKIHQCWSMSAWVPYTYKTGGLPNISFIKKNPELLGEFSFPLLIVVFLLHFFYIFFFVS